LPIPFVCQIDFSRAWHESRCCRSAPSTTCWSREPSNVLKRFKATLAAAGLPQQRFHDLRHYATSFLLAEGVPMRVVMDILGHSQMATTADLYGHVMPAAHRDVAELLDRSFGA
jgi:integrase